MEQRPGIENKVSETLNSVKSIKSVDAPAFFTEKTVSKLRASIKEDNSFTMGSMIKIAAVIVLLIANVYTIKFILNPKQETTAATVTVKDLVNEYQAGDAAELTFEENLNK